MDRNRVEGNWKEMKEKVKEQWDKLTTMIWMSSQANKPARRRTPAEIRLRKDQPRKEIDDSYGRQTR